MKVELTPDAEQWVAARIAAGVFPTPEDAVRFAICQAREAELRAELDAAVAGGGQHSPADVRTFADQALDQAE